LNIPANTIFLQKILKMKFINYLKSIDGVSIYPIVTLLIFVTIFILAVILVFSKDKKTINIIKNLPLQD
jgi:hypothetical protein